MIHIVLLNLGAQGRPDAASDDVYEILIISILLFDSFLRSILLYDILYNIMSLKSSVDVYTRFIIIVIITVMLT